MSAIPQITPGSKTVQNACAFGLNATLVLVWAWLFRPIFPYFRMIATRQDFRSNQIVIVLLLALIIYKAHDEQWRIDLSRIATLRIVPLLLCLTAAIGYVISERFLDINTISAILFVLSSYGLSGLFLKRETWLKGLPVAMLIAGTIPLNNHLQTFLGYPMRITSATLIGNGLASAGFGSIGVDTILIFESGVAHIDIPCSGVQSLWTGMLFLTTATWLEQKRLGLRWLLTAILMVCLLFVSNLVRIGLLVIFGQVMALPIVAEMLHLPLGMLGFILTCLVTLWLLRLWVPSYHTAGSSSKSETVHAPRQWLFALGLLLVMFMFSLFHQPYVRANTAVATSTWHFPAQVQTEVQPLEQAQLDWLLEDGADSADRYRFQSDSLTGSMLFVSASNWHAHHFPEGCFTGLGLTTYETRTAMVSAEFPVRWLVLHAPDGTPYNGVYWFQSAETITDDYATRIWDDLRFERNEWVLVSAIFDQPVAFDSAETEIFLDNLRLTVAADING